MGVVFNNTVVPAMGWDAMFILLGCFSLISFIMLLFFRPVRASFIPYDDERDFYDTTKASLTKENKQKANKVSHDFDNDSQSALRKPLLFVQDK
jgi:hypothetical protein